MFGGEDRHRRLLNDVHVLDLETMTWSAVETTYVIYSNYWVLYFHRRISIMIIIICFYFDRQTPPSPRFDHAAALNAERYLFIFGGCSHSVFYNDLHVLDLETVSLPCFIYISNALSILSIVFPSLRIQPLEWHLRNKDLTLCLPVFSKINKLSE